MNKILIANRGEIALRVMKSCKEIGISTVAIYSEADKNAPFIRFADEAVCVGPPPSSESYLRMDHIIEVAKELGVDGIHPGYGFLSENSEFAEKVTRAGMTFIGPSPEAMRVMGDKLASKEAVKKYDIPQVPGTDGAISDIGEAIETAKEIGFPVIIKASAGGGGKGMRIVNEAESLEQEVKLAMSEAKSYFGNPAVFIERYVTGPRHIEIQVMADAHGNVCYLFERECSVQRRHQKVIEEAPSAVLTPERRKEMGECAVNVARACDYVGAGTVEFLYDANDNFYFLEMNTRLQVEHPVSEMISGVDLVQEQIRVARGEKLSFTQEGLKINGHAIEVRVYAEDPQNNFLPDIGYLSRYRVPVGEGIRVDDGFEEGMDIPIYYDPMLSKLIVHGKDRNDAIAKMTYAIDNYQISGVETTLGFCRFAINHEAFVSGKFDTHFVNKYWDPKAITEAAQEEKEIAAIIAGNAMEQHMKRTTGMRPEKQSVSAWKLNRS